MLQELIERYKSWLQRPYVPSSYYKNEGEWRMEVMQKISELQLKLNGK